MKYLLLVFLASCTQCGYGRTCDSKDSCSMPPYDPPAQTKPLNLPPPNVPGFRATGPLGDWL